MTRPGWQRPPRWNQRRAMVSIVMLIALIVVGLMAASLIRVAFARRTNILASERQGQAEVLVDSAIDRALARLNANPAYPGETWNLAAADLAGRGPARAVITLQPDPTSPEVRRLVIAVEYLASAHNPVRLTRSVQLPSHPSAR